MPWWTQHGSCPKGACSPVRVDGSKQVVTENYEEAHLGGKAGMKQDWRGTEGNGGGEQGIGKPALEEGMSQMGLEG